MTKKTPELLEEIVEVISNDATSRWQYQGDKPGEMCVLGGLAHHASIPLPQGEHNNYGIHYHSMSLFANSLTKRYGLTIEEVIDLQRCNDSISIVQERRTALIALVKEFWDYDARTKAPTDSDA